MIEVLDWISNHWWGVFFSGWFLFYGFVQLIKAWRGNEK